jgi:hypothetical protein
MFIVANLLNSLSKPDEDLAIENSLILMKNRETVSKTVPNP